MNGYPTNFYGMIFVEAPVPEGVPVGYVKSDLSFKIGAQLKNLGDVKRDLADKASYMGANCVADFKYGQKSRWLAIDDVAYFGSGTAVNLPQQVYSDIIAYIQQRDSRQ